MQSIALKPRIIWVFSTIIFFALPILLAIWGIKSRIEEIEKNSCEKSFLLQERILLALRKREDTYKHFQFLLMKLSESLDHKHYSQLRERRNLLLKRFPGILKINVVDGNGDVIESVSEPNPPKFVLKTLYRDLFGKICDQPESFVKDWIFLKSFVGRDIEPEKFSDGDFEIIEVNNGEKDHWFFYSINSHGGVFAHLSEFPEWPDMGIKDRVKSYLKSKKNSSIRAGITSIGDSLPDYPVSEALRMYDKTPQMSFQIEKTLISLTRLKSSSVLWVAFDRKIFAKTSFYRLISALLGTFLFAFFTFFSAKIHFSTQKIFFSIKWRLIILFFYASLLPLLVIFSVGWDYLGKEYEVKTAQSLDKAERTLRLIDSNFPVLRHKLEKRLQKDLLSFRYSTPNEISKGQKLLISLAKKWKIETVRLTDSNGKPAFCCSGEGKKDVFKTQGTKMSGEIMKTVIATLNREPINFQAALKADFLQSFGGVNFISIIVKGMERLEEYQFSNNRSWFFLKPIFNYEKKVTHILEFFWQTHDMEHSYLNSIARSKRIIPKGMKFYAMDLVKKKRISTTRNFPEAVNSLGQWIDLLRTTINRKVFTRSKTYFLTGIKPREIQSSLIAMQDDSQIQSGIRLIRRFLVGFATICVTISIFLGIILSQKLLKPIDNLSLGVQSIEKKMFRFKLPVVESDELGNLTEMFNHMLESLYEVSVAQEVQTRLFPSNVLKIGEYSVFGRSRPATQLGGDYFDYLTIEQRYLLVLVGDVTGHGVPAALVMAMAKGIVQERSRAGEKAAGIISTLNTTLLENFNKKLLMTAAFIWIDSQTHEITFFNCGHPYPFQMQNSGELQMIEFGGSPLGLREKIPLIPKTVVLEQNERIILYTDGLIESIPANEEESQFDKFQQFLASRPVISIEKACDDYLDNHYHTLTNKPQPDDFTVVLIDRKKITS
ncbi:MAG: SpoIIE family protein phosphatase [Candidatus Riflebacteria bacterium]|nr:SpoIIE family protein phosphatase [Candidatus Riflebacteria bacterium]